VLYGSRALSLVGIIEFFMYRIMQYFDERSKGADVVARITQMLYSTRMTQYLEKAQEKALLHKARAQPYYQSTENESIWKYEVECKGKMRLGPSHEKTQQVCEIGNQIC
jgi:murein L,D-transpeptidase YcbB/YkuD